MVCWCLEWCKSHHVNISCHVLRTTGISQKSNAENGNDKADSETEESGDMTLKAWARRWEKGQIEFHLQEVHPYVYCCHNLLIASH